MGIVRQAVMLPKLQLIVSSRTCKAGRRNISTGNSSRSTHLAGGCFSAVRVLTLLTGEALVGLVGIIPSGTNSFAVAKSSVKYDSFCIVASSGAGFKRIRAGCQDSYEANNKIDQYRPNCFVAT